MTKMYIWIAIVAYSLFALNGVADKFLLSKAVRHPVAYAFYLGITSPLTWFLAPFGLKFLSLADLFVAVTAGVCFILASYLLFIAIQHTSISRILPIEGGLVPFFTFILAYLILGERLTGLQISAFVFLISGAVLISFKRDKTGWHPKALGAGLAAALLFAVSLTLTKYIFDQTNFVSGLVWTRLGFLLTSFCFLLPKQSRKYIFESARQASSGNKLLFYATRLTGGAAGLLQNYAIAIGSVTIVNALQGSQYAILLLLTAVLSRYYPRVLRERFTKVFVVQKITAIILICLGLWLITN